MPLLSLATAMAVKSAIQYGPAVAEKLQSLVKDKIRTMEEGRFLLASNVLSEEAGNEVKKIVDEWLHAHVRIDNPTLKDLFDFDKLFQACGLTRVEDSGIAVIGSGPRAGWTVGRLRNALSDRVDHERDFFGLRAPVSNAFEEYYKSHDEMSKEKAYVIVLDNYVKLFLELIDLMKIIPGEQGKKAIEQLEAQLINFIINFKNGPAQVRTFSFLNRDFVSSLFGDRFKTERGKLCDSLHLHIKPIVAAALDEQQRSLYDVVKALQHKMAMLSTETRSFVFNISKDEFFKNTWSGVSQTLSRDHRSSTLQFRFQQLNSILIGLKAQKKESKYDALMFAMATAMILCEEAHRVLDNDLTKDKSASSSQLQKMISIIEAVLNSAIIELQNAIPDATSKEAATHKNYDNLGVNKRLIASINPFVAEMNGTVGSIKQFLSEIKKQIIPVDGQVAQISEANIQDMCGENNSVREVIAKSLMTANITLSHSPRSPVGAADLVVRKADAQQRDRKDTLLQRATPENKALVSNLFEKVSVEMKTEKKDRLSETIESAKKTFLESGGRLLLKDARFKEEDLHSENFIRLIMNEILTIDERGAFTIQLDKVDSVNDVMALAEYILLKLELGKLESELDQSEVATKQKMDARQKVIAFMGLDPLTPPDRQLFVRLNDSSKSILGLKNTDKKCVISAENYLAEIERNKITIELIHQRAPMGYFVFQQNLNDAEARARQILEDAHLLERANTVAKKLEAFASGDKSAQAEIIIEVSKEIAELERLSYKTVVLEEEIVNIKIYLESAQSAFKDDMLREHEQLRSDFVAAKSRCDELASKQVDVRRTLLGAVQEKLNELTVRKEALLTLGISAVLQDCAEIFRTHDDAVNIYKNLCCIHCEKLIAELRDKVDGFSDELVSRTEGFDVVSSQAVLLVESAEEQLGRKTNEVDAAIKNCFDEIAGSLRSVDRHLGTAVEKEFSKHVENVVVSYKNALFEHARDELLLVLKCLKLKETTSTALSLHLFKSVKETPFSDVPEFKSAIDALSTAKNAEELQGSFVAFLAVIKERKCDTAAIINEAIVAANKSEKAVQDFLQKNLKLLQSDAAAAPSAEARR